jgi:Family of unknown function (DUF6629)
MCFSPEADLAAGVVVGVIALDTLRHVRLPERLPLALVPAVFAIHQFVEVFVWWSLGGRASAETGAQAIWWYLLIAFGILPVLVPVAMLLIEPARARRLCLGVLTLIGLGVATALVHTVSTGTPSARIDGHHISYNVGLANDTILVGLYVLACCGAMLVSSHRPIQVYGVANLVVVSLLAWLDRNALVSLWCVWAATTSFLIDVHLRLPHERSHSGRWPARARRPNVEA